MRYISAFLFACALMIPAAAQRQLDLMPMPSAYQLGGGQLPITATFSIDLTGHNEPRLERAAARFMRSLSRQTAIVFVKVPGNVPHATLLVRIDHASEAVQSLNENES